eukprot:TRINITY_DN23142_c0_g1_i1.p1 TRINITY_DN23142_c0_g1~~TRINITY_DN23142_c0_g1_i1.p1  ORF type:complete len:259 (-),score=112.10 TRINITY_DN23142_c0_g1_i1:54-830(-)
MSVPCTKEVILSLIEDIELIAREMLENGVAPKQKRMSAQEHKAITDLLVSKDKDLKAALKLASEQGEVEGDIDHVRAEVETQDQHIKALQGQLKEAETLLASTIYQAKQKLENITRATPVLSEDLIKYSHKISASNAVCAPLNWQQGDPRRPYPTDIEMRGGFLSRAELPLAQQLQHVTPPAASLPPPSGHTPSHSGHTPSQTAGHFSWSSGGEMQMGVGGGAPPVHIDTGGRQSGNMQEEVEVMSTDSSSSSSTDSN